MDIDGVERALADHGILHHHHPGDPEENDVKPSDQDGGREVFLQRFGLFGPAEGPDGPETGGKPCVEDVRIAPDRINQMRGVLIDRIIGQPLRDQMQGGGAVFDFDNCGVVQWGGQAREHVSELIVDGFEICSAVQALVAL